AHCSLYGALPTTTAGYSATYDKHQCVSPHVALLPFLEQTTISATFNPAEDGVGDQPGSPPSSAMNGPLLQQNISVFCCPSDRVAAGGNSYRANMGIGPAVFGGGVGGGGWALSNGSGAFRIWYAIRLTDIIDGTSNTSLFAEKIVGDGDPAHYTPWRDCLFYKLSDLTTVAATEAACQSAIPIFPHESFGGTTWMFGGWRQTWYNHIFAPNSVTPDCAVPMGRGAQTARSFHPGGVNVVSCDGAVHFVANGISLPIWRALSTRAHDDPGFWQ
ncbi:MAG: DUF1559 domain-containing protein, partial [Pirellulales bacterium]